MDPVAAVEQMIAAVRERREADLLASYDDSDRAYVFPEGPRWSTRTGAAVARGWRAWLASSNAIDAHRWVEGPFTGTAGDLAWVAGILDLDVRSAAGSRVLRMRGSYVLHRAGDRWRIVHEHFSQPAEDPYGTGDWLPAPDPTGT